MAIQSNFPAIKPTLNLDFANTKAVDPRITFVRSDSQPIARYYDGKTTAKAEENLLLHSQDFSPAGAWFKGFGAITVDSTTAPDGTTTADLFTASAGTGINEVSQVVLSTTFQNNLSVTMSCFVKAGTKDAVTLSYSNTGGNYAVAVFDLTGVTVSQSAALGTFTLSSSSITSVGSSWYRCTITFVSTNYAAATNVAFIGMAPAKTGNTFNSFGRISGTYAGTETVFLWGAQLEQRSQATAYTPTTTSPITNYIPVLQTAPAGVPRIDHDPITGECKGLLIEEQRTNLLTYSEQFDNAAWAKTNATIAANTATAPDGTLTADKIVENTVNGSHRIFQSASPGAVVSTFSIYLKAAERKFSQVRWENAASTTLWAININLVDGSYTTLPVGSPTNTSFSITSVGNGWFRVSVTALFAGTSDKVIVYCSDTFGNISYPGDGYSGVYIWGAQLEVGAFPTSYIKTEASQVTRAVDVASMTGANFYSWNRADEGSIFAEWSHIATNPGSSPANQYPNVLAFSATRITSYGSSVDGIIGSPSNYFFVAVATKKISVAYSGSSSQVVTDGTLRNSFGSAMMSQGDKLLIGNSGGGNVLNGHIKRIAYYPKRLSNTELQAITT